MSNNKGVKKIQIFEGGNTSIFSKQSFVIPLYQRAYAWKEKEIEQLIDDIDDIEDTVDHYYIGTLIVHNRNKDSDNDINNQSSEENTKPLEVIDGQQRLTTLFLLFNYLNICEKNDGHLTFECRDRSNDTLNNLLQINNNTYQGDLDKLEKSIIDGSKIIKSKFREIEDQDEFKKKLEKVVLYQIEVPKNTDLNRYFEIMNSRGEQLEQHDILKAKLIDFLDKNDEKSRTVFSTIWDACRDMDDYVQMHFHSVGNKIRNTIFGQNWDYYPNKTWENFLTCFSNEKDDNKEFSFESIIKTDINKSYFNVKFENNDQVRFTSIINNFTYFLLHTLKVFVRFHKLKNENDEDFVLEELLDDKKLISSFDKVINEAFYEKKKVSENKSQFSQDFIILLLKTRFLYDRFIIKSEKSETNKDGEWSLNRIDTSGQQSKKRSYYRDTFYKAEQENCLMLEACLRISYTSPKIMHWITYALYDLIDNPDGKNLYNTLEQYTKGEIKKNFFDKKDYDTMGLDTPHIVFNYLDFILWKNERKNSQYQNLFNDFEFNFRNSVEHFYPQHPTEVESVGEKANYFGNLALLSREINSKFSNLTPRQKIEYGETKTGSLKLRLMSDIIRNMDEKTQSWIQGGESSECFKHGEKMLDILYENIYSDKRNK